MADPVVKPEPMVKVLVKRSYWDANENRIDEGAEAEVPDSAAKAGIESGIFEAVKAAKA